VHVHTHIYQMCIQVSMHGSGLNGRVHTYKSDVYTGEHAWVMSDCRACADVQASRALTQRSGRLALALHTDIDGVYPHTHTRLAHCAPVEVEGLRAALQLLPERVHLVPVLHVQPVPNKRKHNVRWLCSEACEGRWRKTSKPHMPRSRPNQHSEGRTGVYMQMLACIDIHTYRLSSSR
jgi:hypothetical protein